MTLRKHLARVKRRLLKKPFLKDKSHPPYWFKHTFGDKPVFLVQIGSNDGKTGDPFYELLSKQKAWKALFVEPVPYLFERLKSNYPDNSRFQFANVAINEGKDLEFYWVDPKAKESFNDLPFWFDQLGSFNKQHIINELGDRMLPFIMTNTLRGQTLADLFSENDISKIDILHIDTEGYDWKILSQLDLNRHQPNFILFESAHLSAEELAEAHDFLTEHYGLYQDGIDTLAVNRALGDAILAQIGNYMKTAVAL